MRKYLFAALLLLAFAPARAQSLTDSPYFGFSGERFRVNMLDYLGFGFLMPQGGDAAYIANTSFGKNRELFFNLVRAHYNPWHTGTFSLGADLQWTAHRLNRDSYWLPDGAGAVSVASSAGTYKSVRKSTLRVMGFAFPLDYTQRFGPVSVSLGALAELNFPGRTKFRGVDASGAEIRQTRSGQLRDKNIRTETFTYSFRAMLSYWGYGLYFRYRPVPLFVDCPQVETFTVGLIFR